MQALPAFPVEHRITHVSLTFNLTNIADPQCSGKWSLIFQFIAHFNPDYDTTRPAIIGALLALGLLGSFSNGAVIMVLSRKGKFRLSGLSALMLQLAVADWAVSVFCLMVEGLWNITVAWFGGEVLCRVVKFMQMLSLYASTMILTGMTVERCITMIYPLSRSQPQFAMQRARFISLTVWSLAIMFSVPQMLIFRVERAPICVDFYQCVTFGAYSEEWQEVAYAVTTLVIMFAIPLMVNGTCCAVIFIRVSHEAKLAAGVRRTEVHNGRRVRIASMNDPGLGRKAYRRTRQFSLWTTFFIAVIYLLCWCPYYASMIAHVLHYRLSSYWMTIILCFGMTSTVLNPMIYGIFHMLSVRTKAKGGNNNSSVRLGQYSLPTNGMFLRAPSSALEISRTFPASC